MTYQQIEMMTAHRPLPPVANAVFALAVTVLAWEQRQQTRRALKRLDAQRLVDIGLSQDQARAECKKVFWQA
ncbi:DUF1127 domain-containing protein [Pseudorhodobacter ferrugineus]|uniref:DUF1127 domain-containing protein n=1 Tax=Pseudorhodobacter ferrugineus TaxID=77008 RepID=UPI0003B460F4|nr:DUF1127 domain-containing protein [Pseudorhodobacter ferrugineus]